MEFDFETASISEIRTEHERQEVIAKDAKDKAKLCDQAIASKIAEFSVGDRVQDKDEVILEIGKMKLSVWINHESVDYMGYKIKKDGTPGIRLQEIWRKPLRLAEKSNKERNHGD